MPARCYTAGTRCRAIAGTLQSKRLCRQESPIFADLDQQPWSELTHAYGSAKDVPTWLRQLTSANEKVRRSALMHLYGSICHQSWNCPATAYAVPYVIELLQQPSVEQKAGLLDMLADIAACAPLQEMDWRENTQVPSYRVPRHIPLKDAHTEVAAGIPTYITLLDDPNLETRVQAAHVLSAFPEHCDDLWPALEPILRREPSESGRADLTFALGLLARSSPERWRLFEPAFEQPDSDLLRYVAARTITSLAREDTPEPVIRYLGKIAQHVETPPSLVNVATLTVARGGPRTQALRHLLLVGRARRGFLIRPLLDCAASLRAKLGDGQEPFTDWSIFNWIMEWLIITLFDQHAAEAEGMGPPVADLTADQRDFLLFALHQGYWHFANFTGRLAQYGLPSQQKTLAEYLGVPTPPERTNR